MEAPTILAIYLALFFLKFAWERLLTWLNIRHVQAHASGPPPPLASLLDTNSYANSVEYTVQRNRFSLLAATAGSLFLLFVILSGLLGSVERLFRQLPVGGYLQGILYIYGISLIFNLVSLPFTIYTQFVIEERFGFNKMTAKLFLTDMLKGTVIFLLLMTPLLYALFWFMDTAGPRWWIWAFLLISAFQLIVTVLYPTLIAPLFNKFQPLEEGALREKILNLAGKLGFRTKGILTMDGSKRSSHSNAYFTGLGRTKRIVLFDTLIQTLEEDQIVAVLAHEIGHEKRHHLLKRTVISFGGSLLGLWLLSLVLSYLPFFQAFGYSSASYAAAVVVFGFCAGPLTFFLRPLFSLWSRKHEFEADHFAARALEDTSALSSALITLSKDNLSNLTPHPWYSFYHYSHPTLTERLKTLAGK